MSAVSFIPISNLMLVLGSRDDEIESLLLDEPPRLHPTRHEPANSPYPIVTAVSRPLSKLSVPEDPSDIHIKIIDFGHSTWIEKHFDEDIQPASLVHAPEVILGYPWSAPVDIWTVGCLIFEFLTGADFMHSQESSAFSAEEDHLARMIEITGEAFSVDMLEASARAPLYLELEAPTPKLNSIKTLNPTSVEECIRNYRTGIDEDEIRGVAGFMRRCLALQPKNRASTASLKDPWLVDL